MQELETTRNNRSMAQVERELNQTRAHLDRTLTELEHKFSSDYVKEYVSRRAGEAFHVTRELVAKYPVTTSLAATLFAAAIAGWGYRRRSTAGEWRTLVHHILEEGRKRNGSIGHAQVLAKHAGQQAGQAARTLVHEAAHQGHDALDRGTRYALRQASRVGDGFVDAREQQPLITGLVLGVALAALGRRIL
jgi:hypothetical protein